MYCLMQRRLRAHHLLCIPLFQGYGYSDAFCSNMEACIRELCRNPEKLLLTDSADDICAQCPNLSLRGECTQRVSGEDGGIAQCLEETADEKAGTVSGKDRRLLTDFALTAGAEYDFYDLLAQAEQKLTKETFDNICGGCRWYAKGLCSFENWQNGIRKLRKQ